MKRIPVKVTPVVAAKPVAKKPVLWKYDYESRSHIDENDAQEIIDNGKSGGLSFNNSNIKFNVSQLPYCCGVFEIGELGALDGKKIPQEAFNELMEAFGEKGYTFIVNTITTGGAKSWEPFLDACPSFQLVKSFKNENSGSIVKIWLSTN